MKRRTFLRNGLWLLSAPALLLPRKTFGQANISNANLSNAAMGMVPGGTGLKTSLVGYWPMEQATNTNAPDSTPQGNTLTRSGTTIQQSQHIGGTFSVQTQTSSQLSSGSTDLVFLGNTSFSMVTWVFNPSGTPAADGFVLSEWNGAGTHKFTVNTASQIPTFFLRFPDDTANYSAVSTKSFTTNTWHMLACGYDGGIRQLWIQVDNETRVSTNFDPSLNPPTGCNFCVGDSCANGSQAWDGYYDEVAFWKARSISTSDVSTIWNGGTGLFYGSW